MTNQHLITPTPELVEQWWNEVGEVGDAGFRIALHIATQAARWGADQELEACCAIALVDPVCGTKHQRRMLVNHIREQRRPKPPSLKEQALEVFDKLEHLFDGYGLDGSTIRRALEALPDN